MQKVRQIVLRSLLAAGLCGLFSMSAALADNDAAPEPPNAAATQAATQNDSGAITPPQASGNADMSASPAAPASPATGAALAPEKFDGPTADIITSMGTITLALDARRAPKTVQNFIRYARWGRFNHKVVYRVEPGFVVQMGCVDARGHGCRQSKPVPLESSNGLSNVRGAVAMAHGEKPDSATSEFFINLADHPTLDAVPDLPANTSGFAVFAHVIRGMDVLDKIAAMPTQGGYGPFPDQAPKKIINVYRIRIHMPRHPKAPAKK